MPTGPEELAYIAAFVDGEGSITVSKRGVPRLAVSQKDPFVLFWIQSNLGGSLRQDKKRNCWWWVTSGHKAQKVLRQIYPYLRLKRRRAKLAMKMPMTYRGGRLGPVAKEWREWTRQEIMRLNHLPVDSSMGRSGPETKLQRRIRRALDNHGGSDLYIVKNHGGPHSLAGVPDFTCCYRGHYVGLEVKVPPNTATEKQQHHIELVRRAGGHAFVVTSTDEALRVLKLIDKLEDS